MFPALAEATMKRTATKAFMMISEFLRFGRWEKVLSVQRGTECLNDNEIEELCLIYLILRGIYFRVGNKENVSQALTYLNSTRDAHLHFIRRIKVMCYDTKISPSKAIVHILYVIVIHFIGINIDSSNVILLQFEKNLLFTLNWSFMRILRTNTNKVLHYSFSVKILKDFIIFLLLCIVTITYVINTY